MLALRVCSRSIDRYLPVNPMTWTLCWENVVAVRLIPRESLEVTDAVSLKKRSSKCPPEENSWRRASWLKKENKHIQIQNQPTSDIVEHTSQLARLGSSYLRGSLPLSTPSPGGAWCTARSSLSSPSRRREWWTSPKHSQTYSLRLGNPGGPRGGCKVGNRKDRALSSADHRKSLISDWGRLLKWTKMVKTAKWKKYLDFKK